MIVLFGLPIGIIECVRFVFWQQFHSPHQYALLDALSRHPEGHTVELVLDQGMSEERRTMHWSEPQYEHVTVHVCPSRALIDLLVSQQAQTSVHIFSGLRNDGTSARALDLCRAQRQQIVVMAEGGDWTGHSSLKYLRLLKHRLLRARYGRHIRQILAIGELGVEWYRRVGYPQHLLTPFAYFVEISQMANRTLSHEVEFLFVGRALTYKGGHLLIEALGRLKHLPWSATLVTEGPQQTAWEALTRSEGIENRIHFRKFEAPADVARRMANAAVLVLPNSADEGWGAVVNEALFQGTPVICTTLTGAKDMVQGDEQRGQVIEPNLDALAIALEQQILRGSPSEAARDEVATWARMHWSGHAGAQRLLDAVVPARRA